MVDLPTMPPAIARLPRDHRGFPVPWFVATIDGRPDFRVIGPGKVEAAVKRRQCWVCGGYLGRYMAFVIGPMCAVNRVSAEPPSHRECAEFSARACPFLTRPRMRRNDKDLPSEAMQPGGVMLARNPGVAAVWITRDYRPFRAARPDGGPDVLFKVGTPATVLWFAEGRAATRDEVLASIDSGLPVLQELAEQDGAEALAELRHQVKIAHSLLPEAA